MNWWFYFVSVASPETASRGSPAFSFLFLLLCWPGCFWSGQCEHIHCLEWKWVSPSSCVIQGLNNCPSSTFDPLWKMRYSPFLFFFFFENMLNIYLLWEWALILIAPQEGRVGFFFVLHFAVTVHESLSDSSPDAGPGWSRRDVSRSACILSFAQILFPSVLGSPRAGQSVWPHKSTDKAANRQLLWFPTYGCLNHGLSIVTTLVFATWAGSGAAGWRRSNGGNLGGVRRCVSCWNIQKIYFCYLGAEFCLFAKE